MAEAPAAVPTLRLAIRHPVPLLVRLRGGKACLADDAARTEVAVRGVPAEALRELLLPVVRFRAGVDAPDLRQRKASRFEGRLWIEIPGVASQLSRMSKVARSGLSPCRIDHGLMEAGPPFWIAVAPHLARLNACFGRETPEALRRAAILDLSAEAAEGLRRHAAENLIHAGGRLHRAVSPPAVIPYGEPLADIPETVQGMATGMVHASRDHYAMPYARLDGVDAFADLMGASAAKRDRMRRAAAEVARHVAGIDPGERDLDAFVDAAPSELLDMLRQGDPGEELAALGESLWPWAARGAIAAVRGADRPEATLAIRRVAEAMAASHPIARHRNRCAFLVRYVDAVVRPRLDAGREVPEDDALSLAGLARGP